MPETSIVENSPFSIFYFDTEGSLVYANPAAVAVTGYTSGEIISGGFDLLFDKDTVAEIKEVYIQKKFTDGVDLHEMTLKCKDGGERILQITSFIAKDGVIAAIAVDLTDMRALESELITAKNLAEKASRAKSEFLSRMSHEMRTPMNAIIGLTELAKGTDNREKLKSYLEKTGVASKQLLGIINEILDMTVIESGNLELVYDEFSIRNMFFEAVDMVNFSAGKKEQNLVVNIDDKFPPIIICDEQRFKQVIVNLLSNAIKFTPEGGNITLDSSVTDISGDVCTILTVVSDEGIGITAAEQKNLFIPFEQLDGGVSRKYGGAGLGLAICRRIVEKMDGKIWVDSEYGGGSKFSFTVRVKKGAGMRAEPSGKITPDGMPLSEIRTIIVAEDVEINRVIVEEILSDTGLAIDFAENGRQAVDLYKANPYKYNLIFMDINMPEMDGYTATRLIRASGALGSAAIPIIAMTANVFQADIDKCLEAGMNDHIGKPINVNELMTKLAMYMS
jgi:PAS domain S-box-containing protein